MTKHEEIIKYIHGLKVGAKISVRSIASALNVSDGTAYRAIKEAETIGLVNTVPRVGTVRIEKVEKKNIEKLTFAEVVNIIDGSVLGGRDGLYKTLNKFTIGAMTVEDMEKYLTPGNLMIVGNREEAQILALEKDCAVLITGGFGASDIVKALANQKKLPLISCTYDTFTTATMINKAISENLIKKDIILVEDIMKTNVSYAKTTTTIGQLKDMMRKTRHGKFPVVDEDGKVVGIITLKDISIDIPDSELITKHMTKEPIMVGAKTSIAYVAHIIVWEGIEILPVAEGKRLIGVVSRQDIIKALQYVNKQPQVGETMDDVLLKNFVYSNTGSGLRFSGKIFPEMLSPIGTASWSAISMLLSRAGTLVLTQRNNLNIYVDSFSSLFIKPVQVDTRVFIEAKIIDPGRNYSKVEIDMYEEKTEELIGKAMLSAKILRK